jgi:hypothetical protein
MAYYLLSLSWHMREGNWTEPNLNRLFDFTIMTFAGESSDILTSKTSIFCDILWTDIDNGVVQNCPETENFSAYFG